MDFEVSTISLWADEKWNNFDTKSSLSPMKHTRSFYNFCNWKLSSYFSSNGTLKSLNGVCILTKAMMLFLPTSNMLMWSLGRIRVKHTCIAYIAKSNNGSWRKISYTQIKVCMCVEMGWSWLLHSNDSFSILYSRAGLVFFPARLWTKCVLTYFYGPSCVHFFLFFSIL